MYCNNPNSKPLDMVLSHFATMDQNYGMPSQHSLRRLKIYTTLRKILLNGAYRVNAMCSLYNDIHNIFPSIWNGLHYFFGSICSSFIFRSHKPVFARHCWHRWASARFLVLNAGLAHTVKFMPICYFSFHIYICMSSWYVINDNLSICPPCSFWLTYLQVLSTTSLYMLDSRCGLICIIYAQFYLWFLDLSCVFFLYGLLLPKIMWIYRIIVLVICISCTKSTLF